MRIVVNKHGLVYLDFERAGSVSLQLHLTYHRLLHVRVTVNSHALPVHKKNRVTSLLCIFETTVHSQYLGSKKPLGGFYHYIKIGSFF